MSKEQPTPFINPETPGYVGFANLPNQVHRKSVKKGFEFTLMVVGKRLTCALGLLNLWVPPFATLGCDGVGSGATGFLRGQSQTPREFGEIL